MIDEDSDEGDKENTDDIDAHDDGGEERAHEELRGREREREGDGREQ